MTLAENIKKSRPDHNKTNHTLTVPQETEQMNEYLKKESHSNNEHAPSAAPDDPFVPEFLQKYYYIGSDGTVKSDRWLNDGSNVRLGRLAARNCFRAKSDAAAELRRTTARRQLEARAEESQRRAPVRQRHSYHIVPKANHDTGFAVIKSTHRGILGAVEFGSREDAEAAVREIGADVLLEVYRIPVVVPGSGRPAESYGTYIRKDTGGTFRAVRVPAVAVGCSPPAEVVRFFQDTGSYTAVEFISDPHGTTSVRLLRGPQLNLTIPVPDGDYVYHHPARSTYYVVPADDFQRFYELVRTEPATDVP